MTVADDLLKNDGKKFIEMMEQLAERRMARDEEAQYAAAGFRHPSAHNHGPPLEEDEYEDEDDEEYASEDDEDYEEDEMVRAVVTSFTSSVNEVTGEHERRAAHGGRSKDVSDLRCSHV